MASGAYSTRRSVSPVRDDFDHDVPRQNPTMASYQAIPLTDREPYSDFMLESDVQPRASATRGPYQSVPMADFEHAHDLGFLKPKDGVVVDEVSVDRSSSPLASRHEDEDHQKPVDGRSYVDSSGLRSSEKFFTPFFLRRTVLLAFALLFVAMIFALIGLYIASRRMHGFVSTDSSLRYLWRLGPTAFIAVIIAFWGQVELRVKQAMPWYNLQRGQTSYEETVGLDYIDLWAPYALLKATKARHWPVVAVILGWLFLNAVVIAASGLFVEHGIFTIIPTDQVTVSSVFNRNTNATGLSSDHLATWAGVSRLGLGYPLGTTDHVAYQTFNTSVIPEPFSKDLPGVGKDFVTISATINAFDLDLKCVTALNRAEVKLNTTGSQDTTSWRFPDLNDTIGDVQSRHTPYLLLQHQGCDTKIQIPSSRTGNFSSFEDVLIRRAETLWANCSATVPPAVTFDMDQIARTGARGDRDRLLLVATNPIDAATTVEMTVVFCTPSYDYGPARMEISYLTGQPTGTFAHQSTGQFENLTAYDLLENVIDATGNQAGKNGFWMKEGPEGGWPWIDDTADIYFQYMNLSDPRPVTDYLDAGMMTERAKELYQGLGVQILHASLSRPDDSKVAGTVNGLALRLEVATVSVSLMIAFLMLMIGVALYLMFHAPRDVTPCDPSSIAGTAILCAASGSALARQAKHLGLGTNASNEARIKWWRPAATTLINKITILVLLVAIIVVLEVLWRLSQREDGLSSVPSNDYIGYLWTYIPTLLMVLLGTMIDGINFTMRILQPYVALRKGNATARLSILDEKISGLAITRLWDATYKRQLAMIVCSIAVLLSPLLTVAVSGLYFDMLKPTFENGLQVSVLDNFEFVESPVYFPRNLTDEQNVAMGAPALMIANGLPAPRWTTRNLALPRISVNNGELLEDSLKVRLTAFRGHANCSFIADPYIRRREEEVCSVDPNDRPTRVNGTTCPGPGNFVKPYMVFDITGLQMPERCNRRLWTSQYLGGDGLTAMTDSDFFEFPTDADAFAPIDAECMMSLAAVGFNDTATNTSTVKLASCNPYFESVVTDVTLKLPEYDIKTIDVDESTKKVLGRTTIKTPTLFPNTRNSLNPYGGGRSGPVSDVSFVDAVVTNMMVPGAIPHISLDNLRDEAKHQQILDAMNEAWQLEAAQIAHNYFRVENPQPQVIEGTLIKDTRRRLVQSTLSTRMTQGVLGAILLLMVVLFVIRRDTNKTVPYGPPTTIAVVARLIEKSHMQEELRQRPGVQYLSDHEMAKQGVFGFQDRYSMRWWDGKAGERWFGIDREGNTPG